MQPNAIIEYYDQFALQYNEVVQQERDYTAFEKIPTWILERRQEPSLEIIDLGCGTGLGGTPFLQQGHFVTGLDISPKMLEKAASLPYKQLLCQSLEKPLPFSSQQFDVALMLGVMEFIHSPASLFAEVGRVLKNEGYYGITVPCKLPISLEKKLEIFTYERGSFEQLLLKAGFEIVYTEAFQGFISQGEVVSYQGYLLKKLHFC